MNDDQFNELKTMLNVLKDTLQNEIKNVKGDLEVSFRKSIVEETTSIKNTLASMSQDVCVVREFQGRLSNVERRTIRILGELSEKGLVKLLDDEYADIRDMLGKPSL